MKVPVLNIKGKTTGREVELSKNVFGIDPNDHAVYLDVKQFLANQRQGNAKTKERSEIKGSTRKIKKQKGTGTARAGSIKNPLFRGGGTIFGPRTRDYGIKLNKNVKRLARKSALSLMDNNKVKDLLKNEKRTNRRKDNKKLEDEIAKVGIKGIAYDFDENNDGISALGSAFIVDNKIYSISIPVPSHRFSIKQKELEKFLKEAIEKVKPIIDS